MLDSKSIWNQYKQRSSRTQKISQHYKSKLLNLTAPKKKSKKYESTPNTSRTCKKKKLQSCIKWKNKPEKARKLKIQKKGENKRQQQKLKKQQLLQEQIQQQKQSTVIAFRQIETARQLKFLRAAKKLFRTLDFQGKGLITQENINRWVPQSALYFLGTIFQQVKNQRKTINEQEFVIECEQIGSKSSKQDIQFFVKNIQQMSLPLINEQAKKSACLEDKPDYGYIQSKVKQKIRASKFKENEDCSFFARKAIQRQKKDIEQIKQIIKPLVLKEDRQRLRITLNVLNQMTFNQRKQQRVLNETMNQKERKNALKQKQRNKQCILFEQTSLQLKPLKMRQQQSVQKQIKQRRNRQIVDQELKNREMSKKVLQSDYRIDSLSSKLEQFIKKNAERIQRSKNVRKQI